MSNCAVLFLIVSGLFSSLPGWAETLPSGTKLVVRLERDVDPGAKSKDAKKAPEFSASLASPVFYNEHEVIPAGSRIEGEVRGSKKTIFLSPRRLILPDGRQIDFNATVDKIGGSRLKAEEKEGSIQEKGSAGEAAQQAGEVGATGAVIGAISTGSWEGMGIGAAAGVGGVLIGRKIAGRNHTATIPAGTQLTLNLIKSLDVPDSAADAKPADTRFPNREDQRPILRRQDPDTPAPSR